MFILSARFIPKESSPSTPPPVPSQPPSPSPYSPPKEDNSHNTPPGSSQSTQPSPDLPSSCSGCILNGKCVPIGYRTADPVKGKLFCDVEGLMKQKETGASCENNYECLSNQCINGTCTDLLSEVKQMKSLLQKILEFLLRLFSLS